MATTTAPQLYYTATELYYFNTKARKMPVKLLDLFDRAIIAASKHETSPPTPLSSLESGLGE
jgi:hypothetical protein